MSNEAHILLPKIKKKKSDTILENLGLKYFKHIAKKNNLKNEISIKAIPSDKVLQSVSDNITTYTVIIAFLVGALTTVPTVIFEIYYKNSFTSWHYYSLLIGITVMLLMFEVVSLYWLAMRSSYTLAELMGYPNDAQDGLPPEYDIKKIMIRSALELDDLSVEYLGINLDQHISKRWVAITGILYKAKVVLSSTLIRIALTKLFSRQTLRVSFIWIAIPVTAIWDAIVMYRVIKDIKLRLYGYHLSKYIIDEILNNEILKSYNDHTKEGLFRAVSTIIVLSKNYHPNNIILLIRLSDNFNIRSSNNYDDLEFFLKYIEEASLEEKHLLRTFSAIASVFDGKLNRKEKKALLRIFGEEHTAYMVFTEELKFLLLKSRIHEGASLCRKNMQKYLK